MVQVDETVVLCPECGAKMIKAGRVWSGRSKVQRYQCLACGRKAIAKSQRGVAR